jgi:hypothetical protein
MTNTPPEIDQMVRQRIMARSGEERFIMGAQMFESAMEMAKASSPPLCPSQNNDAGYSNTSMGKTSIYGIDAG